MGNQEVERRNYNVKPKHAVIIRGIEAKECQTVALSDAEYDQMDVDGYRPVMPSAEFPAFMEAFAAGHIDCKGDEIKKAPEATEHPADTAE